MLKCRCKAVHRCACPWHGLSAYIAPRRCSMSSFCPQIRDLAVRQRQLNERDWLPARRVINGSDVDDEMCALSRTPTTVIPKPTLTPQFPPIMDPTPHILDRPRFASPQGHIQISASRRTGARSPRPTRVSPPSTTPDGAQAEPFESALSSPLLAPLRTLHYYRLIIDSDPARLGDARSRHRRYRYLPHLRSCLPDTRPRLKPSHEPCHCNLVPRRILHFG
jgi:hypothetical protein